MTIVKNVICFDTLRAEKNTVGLMLPVVRNVIASLPLIAVPAMAAGPSDATGITSFGPAIFLFTLATALILTLVFRNTTGQFTRLVSGRIGEYRIRKALRRRSPDVLHDFIIPGAYGGLVRINHAIMTAGGILCIQTKHLNGIVFGGKDEPQWNNIDGVSKRHFLNPLIQNEGRRRALQKIVPDVPVANLVIFTGSVEFSSPPPPNVIRVGELESFVAKFVFGPSKVEDWNTAWLTLKSSAMTDEATRKDFNAQIGFC